MKNQITNRTAAALLCGACLLAATTGWSAPVAVDLYAKVVYLNPITGDTSASPGAGLIPMWGFANTPGGPASVPGPQIDVDLSVNDGLAITVHNELPEPISVVIPGLNGSADVGQPVRFAGDPDYGDRVRSFVPEVAPLPSTTTHTYSWSTLKPGTFVYHSGSHPALQVQMGLFGMVTIKVTANLAYPGVPISPGGEVPVILSEVDPVLHQAVADGKYGPLFLPDGTTPTGKTIGSTIHSKPSLFLINGRAYDPVGNIAPTPPLEPAMRNGWTTLFRVINVGWNSHIPSLTGPFPSGSANYLKVIAEDGEIYAYPKSLYAPNMSAMKTMDIQFTPPAGTENQEFQVYDRKLGLANGGGMFRKLNAVALPGDPCIPAAITTGPASQTVSSGTPVILSVTTTGTDPRIYQWRKDSVNIPNATSSTLDLGNVPNNAAGSYDVVVANGCGSVISPAAILTVIPCFPPAIASAGQPASQTVDHGGTASFTVTAGGSAPLSYQWRKGGVNLSNGGNISGANSSTLNLTAVTSANAGNYDVVVNNSCGSLASLAATLAVRPVLVRNQIVSRSNGTGVNSLTTPSIAIDGTSKLLVVAVIYRDTAGTPVPSIASVTTVPTGVGAVAQAFSPLASGVWGNTQGRLALYYLLAPNNTPAGGTSPVRVNFAGTTTMEQIAIVVDLINGANQTTPFGPVVTDYSTANRNGNLSLTPASTTSDLVINWVGYNSVLNGVTDGAGQASRGIATNPLLLATLQSASVRVTSKNGASTTTTMSEAFTTASTVSMGAVAIKP